MKEFMRKHLVVVFGILLGLAPQAWADIDLTLSNAGVVTGNQGETVGWGFTLGSTSPSTDTNFYSLANVVLCLGAQIFPSCSGTSSVGTFSDYILDNPGLWRLVGESEPSKSSWGANSFGHFEAFNSGAMEGLGGYAIAPTASAQVIPGMLYITYDTYDFDFNQTGYGEIFQAPVTINIQSPPSAVPEPGTWVLMSGGFLALFAARRKRLQ